MRARTIENFYKELSESTQTDAAAWLPSNLSKDIGHFNVFSIDDIYNKYKETGTASMPYNRRAYYKISLVTGKNIAAYADKNIEVEKNALLFATPKVPYHWLPQDLNQSGHFCIFTGDFLMQSKTGILLDELPIFKSGGYPVFQLSQEDADEVNVIFIKMHKELASDYTYKYDLLRNYILELIHYGQKLQPATELHRPHTSATRVFSLFMELLERQFPIELPQQKLSLRTAKDFADRLAVHVNHLNKVLKEQTGKTTTDIIAGRVTQEAKILLNQTDWNISEIAYSLGFEEIAHFSNFFKKQTSVSPLSFRV